MLLVVSLWLDSAGEWRVIRAADGSEQKAPPTADVTPQTTVLSQSNPTKNSASEKKERVQSAASTPLPNAPVAASSGSDRPTVEPAKVPEAKSQSILQMLEGHETEVKLGLIIAATAFALGWLCGGSYYARRERKSRYKLRF